VTLIGPSTQPADKVGAALQRQSEGCDDLAAYLPSSLLRHSSDACSYFAAIYAVKISTSDKGWVLQPVGSVQHHLMCTWSFARPPCRSIENIKLCFAKIDAEFFWRNYHRRMFVPVLRIDPHFDDVPLMQHRNHAEGVSSSPANISKA
jgi:hypothetical protein